MSNRNLNYVRFDVGHYLFVCHKSTILRFENSALAKYVSPQFDKRKSEFEYIVIDRDGKHFGSILNFMRDTSSLDLDGWNERDVVDLMREADFYCLEELVELCERQLELRENKERSEELVAKSFTIPAQNKLEIVFGLDILMELLASCSKPTIVISYKSMRKFHIDTWIEDIVKLCNHSKYQVYCFADKGDEICDMALKNFIMSLYNPREARFALTIPAPSPEKFRQRRAHYKCKIFKFWFFIQNDLAEQVINKQTK